MTRAFEIYVQPWAMTPWWRQKIMQQPRYRRLIVVNPGNPDPLDYWEYSDDARREVS